ncbi:MAG TPA: transporter substrate-binding domain-containing protein [Azospira sp.]|nr:transporter substrate-binding domain-containing protein [Azospira sp.]
MPVQPESVGSPFGPMAQLGARLGRAAARWLLCVLSLCLLAPGLAGAEQRVRVGIYQNSPKIDIAADGKAEGIFVDLIEAIAEKEGWRIEYVPGTWSEGLARLAVGQIDLMPDVARNSERERLFAFHDEPVLSSWNQVYARRGGGIRSLLDLNGRRVAVLEGSVQQNALRQMLAGFSLDAELVPAADFAAAFAAVAGGRADAVVTNRFFGVRNAAKYDLEDTAIIFSPSQLFFAAPRHGDPALLAAIDRQLVAFKKNSDSVYFDSLRRWSVDEVRPALPAWLPSAALLAFGLLLAAVAWVALLRRQVEAKTREVTRLYGEVQQHAQALEGRVARRTEELAAANRDLLVAKQAAESADRLKSAFLATMSHELRTPLNSIIGFTGIVLQGLAGPLNDEQKKQLGMVRDSARHLLALINDVLDISKIEAGEFNVARDPFDLAASLTKVAGIVRPLAEKKQLALGVDIDPALGSMTGDGRRVEQILLNLLSNAIKFTEAGSVRLRAEHLAAHRFADGEAPCAAVRVTVSDTGIGIAPEDMDLLFKPFRQIDSALSRAHEGTGLGLAICRRLAALMGGSIEASSRWQAGSEFVLTLPLQPRTPGESA